MSRLIYFSIGYFIGNNISNNFETKEIYKKTITYKDKSCTLSMEYPNKFKNDERDKDCDH